MRSFLVCCAIAALAPLFGMTNRSEPEAPTFPGWPTSFEGMPLVPLPAVEGDALFTDRFEGRMGRFRAGDREVVLRWTYRVGTGLHSGRYCYRGLGYRVAPQPARLDEDAHLWSSFHAERGEDRLLIRERVYDSEGESWPEVSAWFWDACKGRTSGPWWSALVVGRAD